MRVDRLWTVLLLITLYGFLMSALGVAPGGAAKTIITGLLWLALLVAAANYVQHFKKIGLSFDRYGWALLNALLLVNVASISRSLFASDAAITTALGNPYNALALLAPFVVSFAHRPSAVYVLNRFLVMVIFSGMAIVLTSFLMNGLDFSIETRSFGWGFLFPVVFLIGAIAHLKRFERYAVIGVSVLVLWGIGFVFGSRATVVRLIFLYIFLKLKELPLHTIKRVVYPAAVLVVAVFAIQVIDSSLAGGESVFQRMLTFMQRLLGNSPVVSIVEKADTRTFLYFEVINDLIRTGNLLLGKGSSGTYFSLYFQQTGHDSDTRLTVEVGFLAYLLKGGLVAAVLNIVLFLYSSYLAVYKSSSRYAVWIGFMLMTHLLILFVENLVALNIYNVCIWLFVGLAFSKHFRDLDDNQIHSLIRQRIFK